MTWAWGIRDATPDTAAKEALDVLQRDSGTTPKLEAVRLLQILSGGLMSEESQRTIWEGYSRRAEPRLSPEVQSRLSLQLPDLYPTGHPDLDRELSRLFCQVELGNIEVAARVIEGITPESHPTEDIHRLLVLGGLRPPPEFAATDKVAHALLALDWKIDDSGLSPEHQWPHRMAELYRGLAPRFPALGSAMLEDASFGHPRHVNFTQAEGFDKSRAARLYLEIAEKNPDFEWSYATVRLMESIPPEEGYPTLRNLWDRRPLRLPLLIVLSGRPQLEDLDKFLWGLQPNRPDLVTRGLEGLEKTEPTAAPEVLAPLAAIADSDRLREEEADLMARANRLLLRLTGSKTPPSEGWSNWFLASFPDRAGLLVTQGLPSTQDWKARLAGIDWSTGDAVRGRGVAEELACVACHQSSRGLGPDLHGATSRFAREDLFATILDPSRDISSQYRATLIETVEGGFHQGFIVYEAVDGILLQEGPEMMTRLSGEEILEIRESEVSMMPTGLLDQATDGEIADLWAYLETLQAESE
jgi:putative heme-binding domain-containing protein